MGGRQITRREFVQGGAMTAAGLAVGIGAGGSRGARAAETPEVSKTRSYNPEMEYRRLGKTGLWVSAVCLGGHWKRVNKIIKVRDTSGWEKMTAEDKPLFERNRHDVISRCIEVGINLVDACSGEEIMTYAKALRGRRDKMYMTFSWYEKEARFPEWRSAEKLMQALDEGMKEAGLEYVDIWRISVLMDGKHTQAEVDEFIKALDTAKRQGKARCTGVSSHNREFLKMLIEKYPEQIQMVLCPYTADSKELPKDSVFEALRKHDVGFVGIKPFASNSLFKGDSSPGNPNAEEDNRRARLAIRNILSNPAITAPIPGLVSVQQVDNMVKAIKERRELDVAEKAELEGAAREMWGRLPEEYQWLKEWQNV
jgi:aryl-alcohol dehydrogenase-like predicted oxidoreductase